MQLAKVVPPEQHLNQNIKLKALIYGQPGVGKTTLAGSAVQHKDMTDLFFLTIEGGLLSVPSHPHILKREVRNGFDPDTGETASAVARVESYFWILANRTTEGLKANPWIEPIKTVIIDSGTELLTLTLENLSVSAAAKDAKRDMDDLYIADYGKSTASLRRIFRWYRDLPYNVIVTALAKNVYAEGQNGRGAKPVAVVPNFTEKLEQSVEGYFDHVWYMYKDDEDKRFLMTRAYAGFAGKTRGTNFAAKLGLTVDNPNLAQMYDLLVSTEGAKAKS